MKLYWFVVSQGRILGLLFLIGWGLGIFYDLVRVARRLLGVGKWVADITDVLYWMGVTVVLWYAQNQAAEGVVRFCQLLTVAFGMILYYSILSSKVLWVVYTPLHFFGKQFRRLYRYTIGRVIDKCAQAEKRMAYEEAEKKKEKE